MSITPRIRDQAEVMDFQEEVKFPTKGKVATLLPGLDVEIVKNEDWWEVRYTGGSIPVVAIASVNNGQIAYMDGVIEADQPEE